MDEIEFKEVDDSIPGPVPPIHQDDIVQIRFRELMNDIDGAKPDKRCELARRYAILKTEVEKIMAYHEVFIVRRSYWPPE